MTRLALALLTLLAALAVVAHGESAPPALAPAAAGAARDLGDGVSGVEPPGPTGATKAAAAPRTLRLPPLDLEALDAADAALRAERPELKLERTGVLRSVGRVRAPRRFDRSPDVSRTDSGDLVWTLDLESEGALGLRLRLRRCDLPRGATLVLSNPDRPGESYGPLTPHVGRGDPPLWLPTVLAGRARLDVVVPAAAARAPVSVVVDRIVHQYRALEPTGTTTAKVGTCEVDANCEAELFDRFGRAVGRMTFVRGGSSFVCTGTLLNDTDPATTIPWFLTANHCIAKAAEAASLEVFWDYSAAGCGGFIPSLASRPRTSGSVIAATSSVTDFTLLRLTGSVPSGRTYAGWTTDVPLVGAAIASVHHPEGSFLRASVGTVAAQDGSFHDVRWTSGVTEPGSSGSPLIDGDGLVIGQLCCGESSCSSPRAIDSYGRFDRAYPSLREHLDPANDEPDEPTYDDPFPFELDRRVGLELGGGEWAAWTVDIAPPESPAQPEPRLKVRVRGRRGAYVRLVLPDATEVIVPRRSRATVIGSPPAGSYRLELHSGQDDAPRTVSVRVKRVW